MGYRSDVGIKCNKKAYEMFVEAAKANDIMPDHVYKNSCSEYTLFWNCVKWYDHYSDVQSIENVMQKLDEMHEVYEDFLGYKFIRIGEEFGDIETRTNDYEIDFYVTRTFDVDGVEVEF